MTQHESDFIEAFTAATVKALALQASTQALAGNSPVTLDKEAARRIDLSSEIDLASETLRGTFRIDFPESTYLNVISAMLGEVQTSISSENQDGVSELTNIIFGLAKVPLNQQGNALSLARPVVIEGYRPAEGSGEPAIVIPFTSSAGDFWVEFNFLK